jgi:hypothetical protein
MADSPEFAHPRRFEPSQGTVSVLESASGGAHAIEAVVNEAGARLVFGRQILPNASEMIAVYRHLSLLERAITAPAPGTAAGNGNCGLTAHLDMLLPPSPISPEVGTPGSEPPLCTSTSTGNDLSAAVDSAMKEWIGNDEADLKRRGLLGGCDRPALDASADEKDLVALLALAGVSARTELKRQRHRE